MESKKIKKGILLSLVVLLVVSAFVPAATHRVPDDYNKIQEAIDAAIDGDTVLVADGTYTSEGNRDIDFKGKAITVKSENGPESCIIDCDGTEEEPHRGFYFHNDEDEYSILSGFTIINGYAGGHSSRTGCGGGIFCSNSSPIITNCIIRGSSAEFDGGGIVCKTSSPNIINCTISTNTARDGGGIFISSRRLIPVITNCTISGNLSRDRGGGINCFSGNPMIINCTIKGNTCEWKWGDGVGGIYCDSGNQQITNCIVRDNTHSEITAAGAMVTYCNIKGGWEGEGNIDGDPCFAFADDYHLMPGSACIDAGTNTPVGGLPATDMDGNPRALDGNTDGNAVTDMGAYEFDPQRPSISISQSSFSYTQGSQEIVSKTLLIRNCGGGSLNWQIIEDCPWLQVAPTSGTSTGEIDEVTVTVDTNGMMMDYYSCNLTIQCSDAVNNPRIVIVNLHVSEKTVYVPGHFNTIQEAIEHVQEAGVVIVADGVYTGDGNRDIDFKGKAITVKSENGPEKCIIDSNGTSEDQHRGFYFHSNEDTNSILSGFTVINGYANYGGGIYCFYSSATINNCIINGNTAKSDFYSNGGGIYCWGWDDDIFTITDCIITGNSAKSTCAAGGGVCFGGTLDGGGSTFIMTNCTIMDNTVEGERSFGGGLYCGGEGTRYGGKGATLRIINCIISGNMAPGGGGIYCEDYNVPTIMNCTINNNSAENTGGGVYCLGNPTFANCIISDNSSDYGGGMFVLRGEPNVSNCTFTGNSADEGGGILSKEGRTEVTDSILWADIPTEIVKHSGRGSNFVLVTYSNVQNGWEGEGNIDADPCFADPSFWDANGTPDDANDDFWIQGDYHLLPPSLCIDAGDPCYVPVPNETDLDGNPRIIKGRIDMGAYETDYIQARLWLFPQTINRQSKNKRVMAWIKLPEGITKDQIDQEQPILLYPGHLEPINKYIFEHGQKGQKRTSIFILYDKAQLLSAVPDNGFVDIQVIGSLTTGQEFYGTDSLTIL